VILLIGLIVAATLGTFVEKVFEAIKLDSFLGSLGLTPYFERAGMRLRGSRFLGQLVKWFLVIAFLLAASDILGLHALSIFLGQVLVYLPNVFVAALIMLAAVLLANFLRKIISASVMSARLHAGQFVGTLAWWTVVVFGFVAALEQILPEGGATQIIQTLVTGFIAMLALAGGLAFGLGGRDYAAHLLNKLREQTESHR
jgi:hypothetical protein